MMAQGKPSPLAYYHSTKKNQAAGVLERVRLIKWR